jgi:hypothetical protein
MIMVAIPGLRGAPQTPVRSLWTSFVDTQPRDNPLRDASQCDRPLLRLRLKRAVGGGLHMPFLPSNHLIYKGVLLEPGALSCARW